MAADEVMPGVWVGGEKASQDLDFLRKNKILVIVNCTKSIPFCKDFSGTKYRIPIDDPGNAPWNENHETLQRLLPGMVEIIYNHRVAHENVLIHCHAGMERSASVALAVLLKYGMWTPVDPKKNKKTEIYKAAVKHLVSKRRVIFYGGESINFQEVLLKYLNKIDVLIV
jgi:hypothetical protein